MNICVLHPWLRSGPLVKTELNNVVRVSVKSFFSEVIQTFVQVILSFVKGLSGVLTLFDDVLQ